MMSALPNALALFALTACSKEPDISKQSIAARLHMLTQKSRRKVRILCAHILLSVCLIIRLILPPAYPSLRSAVHTVPLLYIVYLVKHFAV